ncbi:hypothetical protein ACIQZO_25685 [Streptomyces sp. NPDC097617]|uniref:hypothetical protein n=1 Tax=Streptomyces sp. NPDC097617 TaxID=3366091 RepID=UPI0038203DD5
MTSMDIPPPRPQKLRAVRTLMRWGRRQRRAATGHFVRGLSYGAGLAAATSGAYWLQQLL